jgi:hypothetical protein
LTSPTLARRVVGLLFQTRGAIYSEPAARRNEERELRRAAIL